MTVTAATKVADSIQYTEDGKVTVKTITGTHIVISFPIDGYNEVLNVYVDPATEIMTVAYDGGTLTLDPTAAAGDMTKAVYDPNDEGEIRLTPKSASTGAEGTIFYDSDDDHVYVGTE